MATVVVNRLEIEPAPEAEGPAPESPPPEPREKAEVSPRDVERALAALEIRRARVEAH